MVKTLVKINNFKMTPPLSYFLSTDHGNQPLLAKILSNRSKMQTNTISFDEFQAALLAERAAAAAKQQSTTSSTMKQKLEYFIEGPQTQIVMLFFIYLDSIARYFQIFLPIKVLVGGASSVICVLSS